MLSKTKEDEGGKHVVSLGHCKIYIDTHSKGGPTDQRRKKIQHYYLVLVCAFVHSVLDSNPHKWMGQLAAYPRISVVTFEVELAGNLGQLACKI